MKIRLVHHSAFLIVILLTALSFFSCKKKNNGPPPEQVRDYTVMTLSPQTVTTHQDFPATMEGQEVIEIRPMINGYLDQILVNEGERVKKGQLLFRIRNPMYEQEVITAQASINKAQADVNASEIEIEKIRPLVEKQIVSEYRLKSAELRLESDKAALAQSNAALSNARSNLAYTGIRSPMNGIIGTIPYKTGALVSSNSMQALTTLSNIDNVIAYFSWNEKQLLDFLSHSPGITIEEKIKNMPPAKLILSNASEYNKEGRIELASGLITTETGSATFKAIFPNPQGIIRSGSSATVRIPEVRDSVFVIPQSATWELQNKYFAYAVGADNKVSAVSFNPVPSDDGKSFLVSDGFKAGDRIVIEGVNSLKDGARINPKETTAQNFKPE
jgi:membrane fusion protein (multidrug efflux system)